MLNFRTPNNEVHVHVYRISHLRFNFPLVFHVLTHVLVENSTAGTAAVAAVSGGGGGAGGVAVDKDKAIEAAIGELISDFNPSQFASMLEETISKMDKQLE